MNIVERIAQMAIEIVNDGKAVPPTNMGVVLTRRFTSDPDVRWHASVDQLNHGCNAATPELALRGLDAKLAHELKSRIDRAQEKIDRARKAMASGNESEEVKEKHST